jgi:hypothetical protein
MKLVICAGSKADSRKQRYIKQRLSHFAKMVFHTHQDKKFIYVVIVFSIFPE